MTIVYVLTTCSSDDFYNTCHGVYSSLFSAIRYANIICKDYEFHYADNTTIILFENRVKFRYNKCVLVDDGCTELIIKKCEFNTLENPIKSLMSMKISRWWKYYKYAKILRTTT